MTSEGPPVTLSATDVPTWQRKRLPLGETGLTVRYERPQDLSAAEVDDILEVMSRAFNGGPSWFSWADSPSAHFIWKTVDRPGVALTQLTEDDNRIIGFSLSVSCRFLLKGSEISVGQGFDLALHPEFQGRRINSARSNPEEQARLNRSSCMTVGLGMHPTGNARRGTGLNTPVGNTLDTLVKPLSMRGLIAGRVRSRSGSAAGESRTRGVMDAQGRRLPTLLNRYRLQLAARLGWSLLRRRKRLVQRTCQVRTADRFDERADEFWVQASEAFDFIQVRDREYLNWRYCDPSGGPFVVRVAEENDVLLGYTALRFDERGAVLADMLTLPGRADVAESLVSDAIELAHQHRSPLIRCWMPRVHPYRNALADAGFVQYRTPMSFNYRARECDPADLALLQETQARVHFMTADTDHI